MKVSVQVYIFAVLSVGFVFGIPTQNLYGDEQKLQGVVENLINTTINTVLAKINDPIAIDALPLNFSDDGLIVGVANASNFKLFGIKGLVATVIKVNVLSLAMNATIKVPQVLFNSKYYADLSIAKLIPLYGSGQLGFTIDDIEVMIGGKVSLGPLSIANVTVEIKLGEAIFDLHGLLNNEDLSALINEVLNDNLVEFLNENSKAIGDIISPIAAIIINDILHGGGNDTLTELFDTEERMLLAQLE